MTLYNLSQYKWELKWFMTLVVCDQRWTRDRVHMWHCGEGPDYPAGRPAQVQHLIRPCFFFCNFKSHSSYISVQEGSPGGYEHRAPVQQTSAHWQGCHVCSWTKRRGTENLSIQWEWKCAQVGPPLWRTEFKPVPLVEGPGRFFNQCIQKKGKAIINKNHLVHAIKNDLDRLRRVCKHRLKRNCVKFY